MFGSDQEWRQALVFATVPMGVFSLCFMACSQVNHLTPETAHASSDNYYRHQVGPERPFSIVQSVHID